MPADQDHYEIYYADKLWALLPAVYRAQDTDVFNSNGPLREMVNRIGAQAAVLRRSIDRLWEDQSIEGCDDWVISYIGDLLATNLVASLDARGQRLDVAKTIYYRRRKGTVAVLEEIAADITGWDARVVEFFRRLGRTRHGLDPEIVMPGSDPVEDRALQLAEGIVGYWTGTAIGGWADLRNAYGASLAQSPFSIAPSIRPPSAFDEYFHTADFRAGRGRSGWYNIPKLGVFLWRLVSFGTGQTTPVQNGQCFTFDPTGREIPLFAASTRPLGDSWVSPQEWQLPSPISTPLLRSALTLPAAQPLYAALAPDGITVEENSLGFFTLPGSFYELVDVSEITTAPEPANASFPLLVFPETGRFAVLPPGLDGPVTVTYHYGFSGPMAAGAYDRRIAGKPATPTPAPVLNVAGGGGAISALLQIPTTGTVSINDSLTYDSTLDATGIQQLTLTAQNQTRPLIRIKPSGPNRPEWSLSAVNSGNLILEGLYVSGSGIVLRGSFASVTLTCCTFDPGSAAHPSTGTLYEKSIDGRDLAPSTLWIEGEVQQLTVDRCILGPIRQRAGGAVENLTISDSIVQSISSNRGGLFLPRDIKDPVALGERLQAAHDPLSAFLYGQLSSATQALIPPQGVAPSNVGALAEHLANDLNRVLKETSLAEHAVFLSGVVPRNPGPAISPNPSIPPLVHSNRLLLERVYPIALADLALAFDNGVVSLNRTTLLGPAYVHRLKASDSILDDVVLVENYQDGCVRFSAWATGSVIPRQYESVQIAPAAPLFTSRVYGNPAYAQLLDGADHEIMPAPANASGANSALSPGTITTGAQSGSEMGAFSSLKNPIKEQSILLKYQEFLPLGLSPVLIHVT
jgi:hypothetical protein